MCRLGEKLRNARNDKGFSLKDVQERTGITNSRLSRAEKGDADNIKITELRKLAELYNISLARLCLDAGLLKKSDLEECRSAFTKVDSLDDEDKRHIQSEIDYIVKLKGRKK